MNRLILACLVLLPLAASPQGMDRDKPERPVTLIWGHRANTMAAGVALGAVELDQPFEITAGTMYVTTASGGGAGATVIRHCIPLAGASTCSGGTSLCDLSYPCTTSSTVGVYTVAATGSCLYPAGAKVLAVILTAGCTSTQPTATNASSKGYWR